MKRTVWIILGIVVLLLVARGQFFRRHSVRQESGADRTRSAAGRRVLGGNGAGRANRARRRHRRAGRRLRPDRSIGEGVLVIKSNNGQQTQVKVTDTTLVEKQASVKLTDLATGETVIVSGSKGADGVITARSVQVAPAGRFGAGGPGATPAP